MTWWVWVAIYAVILFEVVIPFFVVGLPIIIAKIKGKKKDE